jgi:hypothetical protein
VKVRGKVQNIIDNADEKKVREDRVDILRFQKPYDGR